MFSDEFGVNKLLIPGQDTSLSDLLLLLKNKIQKDFRGRFSVVMYSSDVSPEKLLELYSVQDIKLEMKKQHEYVAIRMAREVSETSTKSGQTEWLELTGVAYFAPLKEGIWCAITTEEDRFVDKVLLRFLRMNSPDVSRIGLTSSDMLRILERFSEENGLDSRVMKAITYPFGGRAQIDHDDVGLVEVLEKCREEGRYLDKARVVFKRGKELICDVFVSRRGIFRFYDGNPDFFFRMFLFAFADQAKDTKSLLEHRERIPGELTTHPLRIDFEEDVFVTPDDNSRLIQCLSRMSKSSVSVYHRNPYLHLAFTDFHDSSIYDIFAVSSNSICIVPSFKCTVDSLVRLSSSIFEGVGEGRLEDWKPPEWNINDFFE